MSPFSPPYEIAEERLHEKVKESDFVKVISLFIYHGDGTRTDSGFLNLITFKGGSSTWAVNFPRFTVRIVGERQLE